MKRRGAVTKCKTRLEQCHKNLLNKWMVNCQILKAHRVQRKLAITRLGHCMVGVVKAESRDCRDQWWGIRTGKRLTHSLQNLSQILNYSEENIFTDP